MTTESLLSAPPVVSGDRFRHAMARLPTGVAVVTATGPDGPVGCTVNAVMSLSLRPPSLLVSLGTGSRTLDRILSCGSFGVNVLPWSARQLAGQFAVGTAAQRFAGVDWEPRHGVPVLSAAAVGVVCAIGETVRLHDHTLLAGTVLWTRADERPTTVLYGDGQHRVSA
ncbi:flavin reductase family protein [Streptomyces boluensis]|uniref:Flavin reductase n=1 Tax=Streptomyces boluensis TaxID=1775135 RepID=A0A964URW4_9ACTN|nr:flavin reductase family protein [Streptomyces boluensis]NBE50595.1 flavin reductase [Streptomyces boluensis]